MNLWRRFVKFRIMCSTIFKRRRHSLFTLLLKIVRIWFIFTWNVHCNRIVAFILKFIIHELKLVVNILLLLFIFTAVKMKVYVIWTKLKTTSPFFTATEQEKQVNNNKECHFCLQLNLHWIVARICLLLWMCVCFLLSRSNLA